MVRDTGERPAVSDLQRVHVGKAVLDPIVAPKRDEDRFDLSVISECRSQVSKGISVTRAGLGRRP